MGLGADDIIIIPDVHGRTFWRDAVRLFPNAKYIFLGDYLDPYPEEKITVEDAYRGLKDIIDFARKNEGKVTLLWGNHDLHYLYSIIEGSRFDTSHANRNRSLFTKNADLFSLSYETEVSGKRFLFSHAGVGRLWLKRAYPSVSPEDVSASILNEAMKEDSFILSLGDISFHRGGLSEWGSPVWADLDEMICEDNIIPGIVQIFGHTQLRTAVNFGDMFYCLDCRKCFYLDSGTGKIKDLYFGEDPLLIQPQ